MRRLIAAIERERPPNATVRLSFAPGEAAQVDLGAGSEVIDPATGELRRTWAFVMPLFSQYEPRGMPKCIDVQSGAAISGNCDSQPL